LQANRRDRGFGRFTRLSGRVFGHYDGPEHSSDLKIVQRVAVHRKRTCIHFCISFCALRMNLEGISK
jgi:hypothetical protein